MIGEHVEFSIPPEIKRTLRVPGAPAPLFYVSLGFNALFQLHVALEGHSSLQAVSLALGVVLLALLAFSIFASKRSRVPTHVEGDWTETGFVGSLDGRPASIGWREMRGVYELPEAFLIVRGMRQPLAVLKSAIRDPEGTWAELDRRLVSRRGLIRSTLGGGPRRLVNTR